jgi:hypothetical protein
LRAADRGAKLAIGRTRPATSSTVAPRTISPA